MKRTIQFAPEYSITKSGRVWKHREAVAPFAVQGKYGLQHLAVKIDGQRQFVWQLLSCTWYENSLPLTRCGGLLNWDESNVFVVKMNPKSIWCNDMLISEMQYIWSKYQHDRIPCVSMSSETGLSYSVDEYKDLIKQILLSSVR